MEGSAAGLLSGLAGAGSLRGFRASPRCCVLVSRPAKWETKLNENIPFFRVFHGKRGYFYLFFGFGTGTANQRSQRICFALASIFRAVLRISSPHSSAVCRPVSLRVNR